MIFNFFNLNLKWMMISLNKKKNLFTDNIFKPYKIFTNSQGKK